ncbi:hypothetical protein LX32DRAFT_282292 [Colletotrichum zoysiae]|uniref:Uncharacterized protein n=1 Tax=Colletotrichum zoysiae TaxID=1216348 RepID=A0AAD9H3P5_9PEZI|nr:hypothetical protein LX32DRAFT_282292 [Colletotrichum zoysiae]
MKAGTPHPPSFPHNSIKRRQTALGLGCRGKSFVGQARGGLLCSALLAPKPPAEIGALLWWCVLRIGREPR